MADYRDPKVTTSQGRTGRGTGTWVGIAIAVLVILALIWWWAGGDEAVAPVTEGTVTEQPATTTETVPVTPPAAEPAPTEPTAPAQQ